MMSLAVSPAKKELVLIIKLYKEYVFSKPKLNNGQEVKISIV